jgi:pilus assembly protein FimV
MLASYSVVSKEDSKLRGPKGVDYGEQGVLYGPITRRDTMWRLANKFRVRNDVSVYQVMVAILKKNPSAFDYDNLNGLKMGSYLAIPSHSEVLEIDRVYAKKRADADDEIWVARLNGSFDQTRYKELMSPIEDAKQKDVDEAKTELSQQIAEVKEQQSEKLNSLQTKFTQSIETVETVLEENQNLQDKLSVIGEELNILKQQLGNESEI